MKNKLYRLKCALVDVDNPLTDCLAVAVTVAFFILALWMWGRSGL